MKVEGKKGKRLYGVYNMGICLFFCFVPWAEEIVRGIFVGGGAGGLQRRGEERRMKKTGNEKCPTFFSVHIATFQNHSFRMKVRPL